MARSSRSSSGGFLSGLLDAAHEKRVADSKLQAEIMKAHAVKQEELANKKEEMGYAQELKTNDPAQQMLRRRLADSNPLAEMNIPTADSPDESVSFPATKVDQSSSGRLMESRVTPEQQKMMFITKYNKMMEDAKAGRGPAPHPAMQAVYQKYFNEVNKIKEDGGDSYDAARRKQVPQEPISAQAAPGGSGKNLFQQAMDSIMGKNKPAAQQSAQTPPAEQDPLEGRTAYNKDTDERLVRKGGKWIPLQ